MEGIELIKNRRSIRKYKEEKVSRKTMEEIVEIARYSPSWANFQIARYTFIENEEMIQKIADEGVKGFAYNIKTLKNAKGVAVLSFVQGKSGKLDVVQDEEAKRKANGWEMFDAGIACQTFCLAATAKGVGTCIFGIIDEKFIGELINIPENETVAAVIVYGYPEGEASPTSRKETKDLMRFVD